MSDIQTQLCNNTLPENVVCSNVDEHRDELAINEHLRDAVAHDAADWYSICAVTVHEHRCRRVG